jgi:hypothetical protein
VVVSGKTITKEPKKVNFLRKNNLQIHHEFRILFLEKLDQQKAITFAETMAVIEDHYTFEPTALRTAYNIMLPEKTQDLVNYFLLRNQELTPEGTLACFGLLF